METKCMYCGAHIKGEIAGPGELVLQGTCKECEEIEMAKVLAKLERH